MSNDDKGFDGNAYYKTLQNIVALREKNWKQVSEETGVSASTLARMGSGRKPDAASLAALSAWAGLNPSDFVNAPYKSVTPEPLARISTLLRSDPNLDEDSATAMEAIVRAAYERMRKSGK